MNSRGCLTVLVACAVAANLVACGSGTDTAARDRCEKTFGVGNCVERSGTWVPLASAVTTIAPTTSSTYTATTYDKGQSLALKAYCQVEFKVDSCVYDRNRGEWVPAADAQPKP